MFCRVLLLQGKWIGCVVGQICTLNISCLYSALMVNLQTRVFNLSNNTYITVSGGQGTKPVYVIGRTSWVSLYMNANCNSRFCVKLQNVRPTDRTIHSWIVRKQTGVDIDVCITFTNTKCTRWFSVRTYFEISTVVAIFSCTVLIKCDISFNGVLCRHYLFIVKNYG